MSKSAPSLAQTSNFTQLDWYKPLIEEIHETIKMAVIDSRIRLVEGHWAVGKLIRLSAEETDVTDLVHTIALDLKKYIKQHDPTALGVSERTLWYCLKAYDTYPDFGLLPEGSNISWNKLVTRYLTDSKEKSEIHRCNICGGDLAAACHTEGNGKP